MLFASPSASAQPGAFQPVPVPDDPEVVNVGPNATFSVQEFIRSDQQPFSFDIESGALVNFYVSLDGGPNQQLTTFIDGKPAWTNPPTQIGSYPVEIGYSTTTRAKTYCFELIVMPGATRAFRAQETTAGGTLTHTILVWSGADGGATFDDPLLDASADGATSHDVIPPSIIDPLLNRLGYGLPAPPSVSVTGPATLGANKDGTWRAVTPDPNATYTWEWRARQRGSGGGGPITHYVPYDQWHTAPTAGPVFTHSFPCGVWGDVRVTATGGGVSVQSDERRTFVAACSGGGKGGGAFAEGGSAGKAGTTSGDALSLNPAYPNPARTDVRFQATVTEPATLTVYDALGRTVETRTVRHSVPVSLALGAYAPGLYVARLSTEQATDTHRFAVSR